MTVVAGLSGEWKVQFISKSMIVVYGSGVCDLDDSFDASQHLVVLFFWWL